MLNIKIYSCYEIPEFALGQSSFEELLEDDFSVTKWMECVLDTRKQFVVTLLGILINQLINSLIYFHNSFTFVALKKTHLFANINYCADILETHTSPELTEKTLRALLYISQGVPNECANNVGDVRMARLNNGNEEDT